MRSLVHEEPHREPEMSDIAQIYERYRAQYQPFDLHARLNLCNPWKPMLNKEKKAIRIAIYGHRICVNCLPNAYCDHAAYSGLPSAYFCLLAYLPTAYFSQERPLCQS